MPICFFFHVYKIKQSLWLSLPNLVARVLLLIVMHLSLFNMKICRIWSVQNPHWSEVPCTFPCLQLAQLTFYWSCIWSLRYWLDACSHDNSKIYWILQRTVSGSEWLSYFLRHVGIILIEARQRGSLIAFWLISRGTYWAKVPFPWILSLICRSVI